MGKDVDGFREFWFRLQGCLSDAVGPAVLPQKIAYCRITGKIFLRLRLLSDMEFRRGKGF
jgi:hypothetical protein